MIGKKIRLISARSKPLSRILTQKMAHDDAKMLKLEANSDVVTAFKEYLYSNDSTLITSDFDVAVGIVKLGHEYLILDLVAVAAEILIEKVDSLKWVGIGGLFELFAFVRLVDSWEVFYRLKQTIIKTIRRYTIFAFLIEAILLMNTLMYLCLIFSVHLERKTKVTQDKNDDGDDSDLEKFIKNDLGISETIKEFIVATLKETWRQITIIFGFFWFILYIYKNCFPNKQNAKVNIFSS